MSHLRGMKIELNKNSQHTCKKEVEISKKRIRTTSIMELQNSNTQNGYRIQFEHKIIEDLPENNDEHV